MPLMSIAPADTTPEALEVQRAIWRRMGPVRRLRLAMQMSDDSRRITADGIRSRHPDYAPEQIRFALLRMVLGDELFAAAYPDAPLLPP
jgi:hypothetical protein